MKKEIFSEQALSRLRSPEQLDSLFRVTQPVTWMALTMLCLLAASIVLWSIYGVLSESVQAVGMIIDSGGIVNIYHDTGGKLSEVLVRPGMRVRKGDMIARLSQPTLMSDIITSRQNISMSTNRQQVESGIANFDSLVNKWNQSEAIVSAYDGIVSEVPVNEGIIVAPGSTVICTVRRDQGRDDVSALMYVPIDSGKNVKAGMVARLTPSGTDAAEDGSLMGIVRDVSSYPASSAGMVKSIGNADVAQWIAQRLGGAVVEVRVDLVRDPKSESGFLWSSIVGDHPQVSAGSSCTGVIVVKRTPPLEKVFLKLSQWLRNS
ncbi:MAG: biotin/lipoyl-binding protein [Synergistaceae bacterium]|jgi:multidrug efflux pump subunit AcrA (membrane-fusion protein)|nr:biotin/lipoyl-binding protein [Synergistaceae bacterium]